LDGVNVANYAFAPDLSNGTPGDGFSYDPATFTATWMLTQPIAVDKLMLRLNADGSNPVVDNFGSRLDGEWTNPTSTTQANSSAYPSGNGTAGGDFLFRFNVLPGDVDHSGKVILADYSAVVSRNNATPGDSTYSVFADVNGSGKITLADASAVLSQKNQTLPTADPVSPSPFAAAVLMKAAALQNSRQSQFQSFDLFYHAYDEFETGKDGELLPLASLARNWSTML